MNTNTVSSSDGHTQGLKKTLDSHGRTTGPARRSTKGQWTAQEDDMLCNAVQRFKGKNWKKIAECFKDRSDVQCLHRWQKVLNPELVKGPWTKEEDEELIQLVEEIGPKKWSTIAQRLTGRIGKQCRERWHNHLNPAINKEAWTQEEELMLIQAHRAYGNKWAELTKFLPGRTDNAIKNHWNSSVKKKLDAYLASGMLSQLPGLPCISHTNQSTPTSSRTQQCSGDVEPEEISECSQPLSLVRCSQSNSEDTSKAAAVVVYSGHDNTNHPCGLGEQNDWVTSSERGEPSSKEFQSHPSSLDLDLSGESEFLLHCIDVDEIQEAVTNPIQTCADVSTSLQNDVDFDMTAQVLASEGDIHLADGSSDVQLYQHFNSQIPLLNSQSFYSDSQFPCGTLESESNEFNLLSDGNQLANNSSNSPFLDNEFNVGAQDQNDQVTDPISTDVLSPGKVNSTQLHLSADENLHNHQETGLLSYEPPCFPSSDIPFLSCDLVQSGGDLQHEYSPLGIRQLMMMTNINCFSPCRLWDSPSSDDTPEAVLKTAAKTFICTPSILKKRNRDLLSPLSERPSEKKQERVSFRSAKHLSQEEEVMFEDKENLHPTDEMVQREAFKSSAVKVQQSPRVHGEQKIEDLFFSPDKSEMKSDTQHATTPGNISSGATVNLVTVTYENPCLTHVSPLNHSGKRNKGFENSFANENAGMFGETPFLKILESPSAWKSPWSSFVPGPRVDTDITIEDIGYFTSPVERRSCYDALGLMKQLSEHTASAYASAREVLGDETPDSILKKRFSEKREKIHQQGSSNILSERRVLDFSECGSPRKGDQSARHSNGVSFSSPSSYLLKGCR